MTIYDLLLKNFRKLVLLTISLVAYSFSYGQICPLNSPEFPFTTNDSWYTYSWSSGLYMPSQLGGAQTMSQVSMRIDNSDASGTYTYSDVHVYLRHTSSQDFSSETSYPNTAAFTEVYSGGFTFNGTGIFTFYFNLTPFAYNGTDNLEVLIENRGGDDHTYYDPWFDRTNYAPSGPFIGKIGTGSSFYWASQNSSLRRFNLALQFTNSGDICAYPLPVKLASSNLTCDKSNVIISWETASEKSNDYFTISYSEDGENWSPVKRIDGAGNSSNSISYEEILNIESGNISYYRLSQTDFDGTTEMLNTFTVNCGETTVLKSYPNPAEDKVYLSSSETLVDARIEIYDLNGQKYITTFSPTSKNSGEINLDQLASGVYTLRVTTRSFQKVLKVVKR